MVEVKVFLAPLPIGSREGAATPPCPCPTAADTPAPDRLAGGMTGQCALKATIGSDRVFLSVLGLDRCHPEGGKRWRTNLA
jgi:hypothetical protein